MKYFKSRKNYNVIRKPTATAFSVAPILEYFYIKGIW